MVIQQYQLGKVTTMMRWPEWIWGLAVPIGFGFMAYYSVIVVIRTLKKRGGRQNNETPDPSKEGGNS